MSFKKDSTWSWLILSLISFIYFLEIGTIKGISVLIPDMKEQLSAYTWIVGSCISITLGWGYLLGMSAGALLERFDARLVMMVSSVLSCLGIIICAMSTNTLMLLGGCILIGFMFLQQNVAVGMIPDYFDKYYIIAVNIALFAGGVGVIVTPLLTQTLRDIYGWRGALLLLAGINLHSIACGAFLKKLSDNSQYHELLPNCRNLDTKLEEEPEPSCVKRAYDAVGGVLVFNSSFIAQVLVPSFVYGYAFTGWLVYIVSFATSKGALLRDASVVATYGGIGHVAAKVVIPLLHKCMTYKHTLYLSSLTLASAFVALTLLDTVAGMGIASVVCGTGAGIVGSEIYSAIKFITDNDDECHNQYKKQQL